ncbi:hypothetical protein AB0F72_39295 [Actinoplanes sp. NPDC023936]|uniref:hypothetical protein n=1 Tax=Actinoplanes sp. NPDC023936 TaxID=3154910 RepID=UPI0033DB220E
MIYAVLVYALTVPVVTSWLAGDQTNPQAKQLESEGVPLDYVIRPLGLSPGQQAAIGVVAALLAAAALAVVIRAIVRRQVDVLWWMVLLPLTCAGVILGLTWSTLTAGTIGANIGAGLATIFFLPFAACMLILAALAGVAIRKRRQRVPVPTAP